MDTSTVVTKPRRLASWGPLSLDVDRRCIRIEEVLVPTSEAEFGMLRCLIARRNVPMTKDAILTALYGPAHGRDPRQIDVLVARVRRLLAPFGLGHVISTIAGRGYAVLDDDSGVLPSKIMPSGDHVSRMIAA